MLINLDTDLLRDAVRICAVANEEIDQAVMELNRITEHNDWCCKERDAINSYTEGNKLKIRHLQDCSSSFLNVLSQVATDFEQQEADTARLFDNIDTIIGGLLARGSRIASVTSDFSKNVIDSVQEVMTDAVQNTSSAFGGVLTDLAMPPMVTETIKMVDFLKLNGGN